MEDDDFGIRRRAHIDAQKANAIKALREEEADCDRRAGFLLPILEVIGRLNGAEGHSPAALELEAWTIIEAACIQYRPRANPDRVRKLNKLADLIVELQNRIFDLPSPPPFHLAWSELDDRPYVFYHGLKIMEAGVRREVERLASFRGSRARPEAIKVATASLECFEMVTGRRATIVVDPVTSEARGEFLDFVSEIFQVSEMHSSPEYCARAAIKEKGARE